MTQYTKVNIKPMTVNQAWQGRRYKTPKYKKWGEQIKWLLPYQKEVPRGRLILSVRFGVSSKLSDLDNLLKPFIDSLQDNYGFNDRQIYATASIKVDVPKGEEFIEFKLEPLLCGQCWLDSVDGSPECKCEDL